MEILIETYQRLLRELIPSYRRKFYDDFKMDSRFVGIIGARGVGKTTFLVNHLREHFHGSDQAFYLSADNLYFVEHTLLSTIDRFVKEFDGKIVCIDEIHRYKNWDQELKNIYDSYPKLSVIFSGSSSIDLKSGQRADLSRRALLKTMYGFSFREFLEIKEKKSYPVFSFEELMGNHFANAQNLMRIPKLLGYLKTYLKVGYYPTFLELRTSQPYSESLRTIVDKIIYEDISSLNSINTSNLETLKKIVYFFATAQPGSVNINRLAQNLKKDHSTMADYVQMLRDSGLLRYLLKNKHGYALVRDAEKIYLDNCNLLYALNEEIGQKPLMGAIRELFVLSNLQNAGHYVFVSEQADFECNNYTLEIGGKDKTSPVVQKQRGFIVKDDSLIGDRKTIPLYLFGFLS